MTEAIATHRETAKATRRRRRRPRSYWALRIGLGLLAFYIAVALLSVVWTPYDPLTPGIGDGYDAPSWAFPLGTDRLGADMLSRLMTGARYDLGIALVAVLIAFTVGTTIGVLAGYPMVDVRVTLTDGAYHEVDSSELAFKIAGSMAFKKAAGRADPALLEPVMAVEVRTPDDYMGEVIGDLNSRRGQIQAMEERSGVRVVKATVPLSEMFGYVGDLRSRTQGRADYSMQFDSYAEVPPSIDKEIIAKARGE